MPKVRRIEQGPKLPGGTLAERRRQLKAQGGLRALLKTTVKWEGKCPGCDEDAFFRMAILSDAHADKPVTEGSAEVILEGYGNMFREIGGAIVGRKQGHCVKCEECGFVGIACPHCDEIRAIPKGWKTGEAKTCKACKQEYGVP